MSANTATHEPLFFAQVDPRSWFEKTAAVAKMTDDERKWPAQVISELHKQLPFLSRYDVDLVLDRVEPEAGYGLGYASIRNRSLRASAADEVGKATNLIRVPVIVRERRLQPFHVFEVGGNVYPLTKERVEAAMLNPAIFDGPAQTPPPRSPSLVDQVYPPFQERQGFGRLAGSVDVNQIGKTSSAFESFLAEPVEKQANIEKVTALMARGMGPREAVKTAYPEWSDAKVEDFLRTAPLPKSASAQQQDFRAKFRGVMQAHGIEPSKLNEYRSTPEGKARLKAAFADVDKLHRAESEKQASAEMTKEARYLRAIPSGCGPFEGFAARFEGTPLHPQAVEVEALQAQEELERARERVTDSLMWAKDSQQEVRSAEAEAKLAAWKHQQHGVPQAETLGKLAHCRGDDAAWTDHFSSSPFYEEALAVERDGAAIGLERARYHSARRLQAAQRPDLGVKCAELDAQLAAWRYDQIAGAAKQADAPLDKVARRDMPPFTAQDRPEKVKEIYRALKRGHPDMPAEMKARIAARQGRPGKQEQGPPYKAPIKEADALVEGGVARLKQHLTEKKEAAAPRLSLFLENLGEKVLRKATKAGRAATQAEKNPAGLQSSLKITEEMLGPWEAHPTIPGARSRHLKSGLDLLDPSSPFWEHTPFHTSEQSEVMRAFNPSSLKKKVIGSAVVTAPVLVPAGGIAALKARAAKTEKKKEAAIAPIRGIERESLTGAVRALRQSAKPPVQRVQKSGLAALLSKLRGAA